MSLGAERAVATTAREKRSEQKLVDIAFELVSVVSAYYETHFKPMTQEQRMAWVATQLRANGYHTEPMGLSWGVLCDPPECERQGVRITEPGRPE